MKKTVTSLSALLLYLSLLFICSCSNDDSTLTRKNIDLKFKSGNIAVKGQIIENEKSGEWLQYYPSGKLRIRKNFDSSHDSFWKYYQFYNEMGRVIHEQFEEETHESGHLRFVERFFNDSGILLDEIETDIWQYSDEYEEYEEILELWKEYYLNGNIMMYEYSEGHKVISQMWFDSTGTFEGEIIQKTSDYRIEYKTVLNRI